MLEFNCDFSTRNGLVVINSGEFSPVYKAARNVTSRGGDFDSRPSDSISAVALFQGDFQVETSY